MEKKLRLQRKQVDDVLGGEEAWKNVSKTDGKEGQNNPFTVFEPNLCIPFTSAVNRAVVVLITLAMLHSLQRLQDCTCMYL